MSELSDKTKTVSPCEPAIKVAVNKFKRLCVRTATPTVFALSGWSSLISPIKNLHIFIKDNEISRNRLGFFWGFLITGRIPCFAGVGLFAVALSLHSSIRFRSFQNSPSGCCYNPLRVGSHKEILESTESWTIEIFFSFLKARIFFLPHQLQSIALIQGKILVTTQHDKIFSDCKVNQHAVKRVFVIFLNRQVFVCDKIVCIGI